MNKPSIEEVIEHYNKQVGVSSYRFFDDSQATTRIHEGIPVSQSCFVTIEYENWSIERLGLDAGMHIKVWRNARLDQLVYLEIRYVLMSHEGDFEIEVPLS